MSKQERPELGKHYLPESSGEDLRAELSESDKATLREQIRKVSKSHVLENIDHFLAQPSLGGMEKIGGDVLAKYGFSEELLNMLLISQNRIIESQKDRMVAEIDNALKFSVSAGEELTPEKKDKLATEILRIIHGATETAK